MKSKILVTLLLGWMAMSATAQLISVPNSPDISATHIYNSVKSHAPATEFSWQSFWDNANPSFFNAQNKAAYPNSMLAFMGYTPVAANIPTVLTVNYTFPANRQVTIVANVTSNGGSPLTRCGIAYSQTGDPATLANPSISSIGGQMGYFSVTVPTTGSGAHYRAFAENSVGRGWGELISISTTLATVPATSISATSCVTGGQIFNGFNLNITSRGVVMATHTQPVLSDITRASGSGAGPYQVTFTGLSPSTTYYYRSYLLESGGYIVYGNELSFRTQDLLELPEEYQTNMTGNWTGVGVSSTAQVQAICERGGHVYRSSDYGQNWTRVSMVPVDYWNDVAVSGDGSVIFAVTKEQSRWAVYRNSTFSYLSVPYVEQNGGNNFNDCAISQTGQHMAACTIGGVIIVSNNYGQDQKARVLVGSLTDITMTPSGQYMLCCDNNGYLYRSSDYGDTWSTFGSFREWNDVAISDDGQWMVGVTSTGYTFVYSNYGQTLYSTNYDPGVVWRGVDMSSDGSYIIRAGEYTPFYVSRDRNVFEQQANTPRNWNDIAISSNGTKRVAVVFGGYVYTFNN